MKCLRQVLRVSWTAKKTNEWVLNTAGVERSLLASVKERKLVYFGHVMRKKGDSLKKEIMQGTTPGVEVDPIQHGCRTLHLGQGCQLNNC